MWEPLQEFRVYNSLYLFRLNAAVLIYSTPFTQFAMVASKYRVKQVRRRYRTAMILIKERGLTEPLTTNASHTII